MGYARQQAGSPDDAQTTRVVVMGRLSRPEVRSLIAASLAEKGVRLAEDDGAVLSEHGFGARRFTELLLLAQEACGGELRFTESTQKEIRTLGDLLDYIEQIQPC